MPVNYSKWASVDSDDSLDDNVAFNGGSQKATPLPTAFPAKNSATTTNSFRKDAEHYLQTNPEPTGTNLESFDPADYDWKNLEELNGIIRDAKLTDDQFCDHFFEQARTEARKLGEAIALRKVEEGGCSLGGHEQLLREVYVWGKRRAPHGERNEPSGIGVLMSAFRGVGGYLS